MNRNRLYDNSLVKDALFSHPIIQKLENCTLQQLASEGFIVFPLQIHESEDLNGENYIFKKKNNDMWTCNVVGFIGDANNEIQIQSRFTKKATGDDFFLMYMIQRVMNYNVVSSDLNVSKDNSYFDLLMYLFPYYLNGAVSKGIYKEYVKRDYNDANIKGPIDIATHMRLNNPFIGNISYRTREFSFDNDLTQLIRHTVEKILEEKDFVLKGNDLTIESVHAIRQATPKYSRLDRIDIVKRNILNPVNHGYYTEYLNLQRICIQILRGERIGFGEDTHELNGVIIDVAWLWEQYIWKITGWSHYGRKAHQSTLQLFRDRSGSTRYPDFVLNCIPIDTKYKIKLDTRNDYNQITTYIHLLNHEKSPNMKGGFLQPTSDYHEQGYKTIGILNGLGGELFTYKFLVPQDALTYEQFVLEIREAELDMINSFLNL